MWIHQHMPKKLEVEYVKSMKYLVALGIRKVGDKRYPKDMWSKKVYGSEFHCKYDLVKGGDYEIVGKLGNYSLYLVPTTGIITFRYEGNINEGKDRGWKNT